MSHSILAIAQSKIVKVETAQQAENFSKPLSYPTMMSYQTKLKYLDHFSVKYKAKLSKWRLLDKQKPFLSHDTKLSSQTKMSCPFFSRVQSKIVKVETARQVETFFQTTSLSHNDELSS